jgi:simple sugar transport system ATP-binding protein
MGIVFVTHFLDQVYAVTDRITVLRNGRLVGTYAADQLPRLALVGKMIGREVGAAPASGGGNATPERPVVLRARGLGRRHAVEPMDLDVRRGEVVGLAGLLGSGRTEFARLLFGLDRPTAGSAEVGGRRVRLRSPRRAMAAGLAMLPEDRKAQGIVAELSVRENIVMALQARRGWLRPIGPRAQRRLAGEYIRTLRIATTDADKPVGLLSGGNQQKCVLARWLATRPVLMILDEPTRGVDVGAKEEIERLIAGLRDDGLAILLISSELEEVVRDSGRVVVLRDRRKVGELAGDAVTEPRVMELIAGGAA